MNFLDWFLVVLVLAYAVSGYWQGFIAGVFATLGLLLGGLVGIWVAPRLLGDIDPALWVSLAALFVVLICASFGQAVLQYAGVRVRARITWQPARALDAVGGAALSAVAVLVVSWALGVAVSGASLPWVSNQVRESEVLGRVDELMPARAVTALDSFNDVVGSSFFPRYLEPFARERIIEVGPPPGRIGTDPDVVAAAASVLKIRGENSCNRGVEGTGFLFAPNRVMTNAHVVAGVDDPAIILEDREVPATVVYYNEDLDVAVLAVDGLDRPFLRFDGGGRESQPAAVLGYPQDGPYNVQAARIRGEQRLRSPDIYGDGSVVREVFSIRSLVRPGNSGGPLVSGDGRVLGVIFAASVSDGDTGYALTTDQVKESAAQGLTSDREVDTGRCA
ncbi:MarP family serine protease [Nocardioides mesophilus]|uniref:MarP family serine protease n=1 Tax=Nocardioides mesophilus TaxID=433659 RepID=A0A7G9RGC8_9ACTN|nr:MarP family serine protease [Nocardioides mesophilus]QNN54653.1 MarP family serine protease [Nocardioides mesophilus]